MSFYDVMADKALQGIQKRGNSYTIRRDSVISDPVTGEVTPEVSGGIACSLDLTGDPSPTGTFAMPFVSEQQYGFTTAQSSVDYMAINQAEMDQYLSLFGGGTGLIGMIELPASGMLAIPSFRFDSGFANGGSGGEYSLGVGVLGGVFDSGVQTYGLNLKGSFASVYSDPDGYLDISGAGGSYQYGYNTPNANGSIVGKEFGFLIDCDTRRIWHINSSSGGIGGSDLMLPEVLPPSLTHISVYVHGGFSGINASDPMDGIDVRGSLSIDINDVFQTLYPGVGAQGLSDLFGKVVSDICGNYVEPGGSSSVRVGGGGGSPVVNSGTIQAIILPASKGTVEAFDNRVATDSTRLRKLRFVLAASKGFPFEPQNGDILEVNGEDWLILGATPLAPDGVTPLIYKMGIEKL